MHCSLHVDGSCEQTDKNKRESWRGRNVCVYKHKRMMRVTLHGPIMLLDVTQNRKYALFICGEIPLHYAANAV